MFGSDCLVRIYVLPFLFTFPWRNSREYVQLGRLDLMDFERRCLSYPGYVLLDWDWLGQRQLGTLCCSYLLGLRQSFDLMIPPHVSILLHILPIFHSDDCCLNAGSALVHKCTPHFLRHPRWKEQTFRLSHPPSFGVYQSYLSRGPLRQKRRHIRFAQIGFTLIPFVIFFFQV